MRLGFILTKTSSEEGYKTFLKFLKIYLNEDITIYLLGNGVYNFRMKHKPSEDLLKQLEKSKSLSIFTNQDDLLARGIRIETLLQGVFPFKSYDDLVVDIMENQDQIFLILRISFFCI